jgi:hypothetical protein
VGSPSPKAENDDPGSIQIGCAFAFVGAVLGNVVATIALVIIHPDEVFPSGNDVTTAFIALAIGWVVALGLAVVISTLVIGLGLSWVVGHLTHQARDPLPLLAGAGLVAAMVVAATALWILAGITG